MGKGIWIGLIVIALLVIGSFWIFGGEEPSGGIDVVAPGSNNVNSEVTGNEEESGTDTTSLVDNPGPEGDITKVVINITSEGFSPNAVTIRAGSQVTFRNEEDKEHWPASEVHPTHSVYPGSGREKCGTAEERNIFDACRGLKRGETFDFVFYEKGTWRYHDHLQTSFFGSVTVK